MIIFIPRHFEKACSFMFAGFRVKCMTDLMDKVKLCFLRDNQSQELVIVCVCVAKTLLVKNFKLQFKFKLRLITKPSFLVIRMNELLFAQ